MIINYSEQNVELEEEGRCNLVFVAARYTGDKSSTTPNKYNRQAAWPSRSAFQGGPEVNPDDEDDPTRRPGPAQGALVPDWTDANTENRTVGALESDPDIEVLYRPENIARAMLEANYLDPNVFGRGFDAELRDRVFDALGLEDVGVRNEAEYRQQLREVAGIEAEDADIQAETRDDGRVNEYRRNHTRQELVDAARILGKDEPNVGKIENATWLADQDAEAVRFALEGKAQAATDVQSDGETSHTEPLTVDEVVGQYDHDELKDVVKAVREGTGEFSLRGTDEQEMAEFLLSKDLTEDEIDAHLMG